MPTLTAGQLETLRTYPQKSNLYLIVQQPMYVDDAGLWAGYFWSCQLNGDPAGTAGDLVAALTVNNGVGAVTLHDGMTLVVGNDRGNHEKGIFVVRGDQVVNAATVTLNIGSTSEVVGILQDDDWVVVLDEFRLWTRYPRVVEAGGALSWFKDYGITYASLGANAANRRTASLPPVPIMGPHRVAFLDPDDTVDIDFDWSDSYAMRGVAPTVWSSTGIRGATSGNWNSALQNPPPMAYNGSSTDADNDISGLAGFRVTLEVDPFGAGAYASFDRFRRGVRYVFTLRRPGQRQVADPINAEPITDFEVTSCSGSYDSGMWRASITIFDSQAHEYEIQEGALTILFAEDWYGDTKISVGPVDGGENIIMIGRIADGSVRHDPETGDVSFDVISAAGQAQNREMYPIPVENNDGADEWYKCPDLTVDRAAWFYLVWHSTLSMICDWYRSGDANEILAMDFLAGDVYSTLDSFYQDRIFARVLCDRYERFKAEIDLQLGAEGTGTTVMTLTDPDWLEEINIRETIETPTSIVELGGLNYNTGLIIPFLGKAPGTVNRLKGRSFQSTSMAISDQATLNTIAGRILAKQNARWGDLIVPMGNWRVWDIWPQEYMVVNLVLKRDTFINHHFIPREVSIAHEGGALFVTTRSEAETGGVAGQTIEILPELPARYPPQLPLYPPSVPPTPSTPAPDSGRRIIATDVGVFVTNDIGATPPVWYAVNNGFTTSDDLDVWDIKRDPFHWWTSGGAERTLWAMTRSGVWKHELFPYGTWVQQFSIAQLVAAGMTVTDVNKARMNLSIEVDGRYAFVFYNKSSGLNQRQYVVVVNAGAILNFTQLYLTNDGPGWGDVKFAQHSAGNKIYCAANRAPGHAGSSEAQLWKTVNMGAGWASVNTLNTSYKGHHASVVIPYVDATNTTDRYVLWGRGGLVAGNNGLYRYSLNAGVSFADLPNSHKTYSKMESDDTPDHLFFLIDNPQVQSSVWTVNQMGSYYALPATGTLFNVSFASFVNWQGGVPQTVLIGCDDTTAVRLYLWAQGMGAWANKTGNLNDWLPTSVRQIDRDSMGTA